MMNKYEQNISLQPQKDDATNSIQHQHGFSRFAPLEGAVFREVVRFPVRQRAPDLYGRQHFVPQRCQGWDEEGWGGCDTHE